VRRKRTSRESPTVRKKMLKCVGRKVAFKYPANEEDRAGILIDRAIVRSNPGMAGVPYWDVVDLIRFDGEKQHWIRVGYYRVPNGRLQWGSQTTITERVGTWKRVLVEAAKQKEWFRDLLKSAVAELGE
jgi:hypothetical protein